MTAQVSLCDVLGPARYKTYLDAAKGNKKRAQEIYAWSVELSGAWHAHIGYVEVAVRNSMDRALRKWNAGQSGSHGGCDENWTLENNTGELLFKIFNKTLPEARSNAKKESERRIPSHARHGALVTHDDIVAQITFGGWSRLLRLPHEKDPRLQKYLWKDCLHEAFPKVGSDNQSRRDVGAQMESLRVLRNRIAHHDNLLEVNTANRLNSSLSLVSKIDPSYPDLIMPRNSLRRLVREDPRRDW